jgi:hypothetical protein
MDVFATGTNPVPTSILFTEGEIPPVSPVPALGPAGLSVGVVAIVGLHAWFVRRRRQTA